MVLHSPLDPAGVAAEFPLDVRTPFRLERLCAIWAYLWGTRPASPLLQYLLVMVPFPALVAAEPPSPSCPALTPVHHISTCRTDVYRCRIIPFCVVIPVPAFIAAIFIPERLGEHQASRPQNRDICPRISNAIGRVLAANLIKPCLYLHLYKIIAINKERYGNPSIATAQVAIFLPCDMTGWDKLFSTVKAFFFFFHSLFLFFHSTIGE